jgi:hypothetical protein
VIKNKLYSKSVYNEIRAINENNIEKVNYKKKINKRSFFKLFVVYIMYIKKKFIIKNKYG